MVASKEADGSLHVPLLGNHYDDRTHPYYANGMQEDEFVLPVEENFHTTALGRSKSALQSGGKHHMTNKSEQLESEAQHFAGGSGNPFEQVQTAAHILCARDYPSHSCDGDHHQAASHRRHGVSRRNLRNPIEKKSFVVRAAHSAKTNPTNFLYNVLQGVVLWPKWSWAAVSANSGLTILSLKQGFVAGLASILCVIPFPDPFDEVNSIALWAVVTTDLLYESNIGLSVSKGFNRVLGTLAAGLIAMALNQIGPILGYQIYPYFVVFCVIVGGAVLRFFKGIPPLKDQWGYAFTVATIAFHLFIITAYTQPERWTLPVLRFSMILLGFFMSTLVNLAIKPIYAGDALHKLVAKNFETAASVILRCVEEYNKDTKLDHVPDILSGLSVDDKIHQSYHEVVMSDSDIDKLLSAVHWEPCHGPFFMGYPWDLYDDITDYLRYTLYDVIALDSCLRANIQAPKHLREIFAKDMDTIAKECATVLRTLGESIKNMKKFASKDILRQAQEAAVLLQYNIYVHTDLLLGSAAPESPMHPAYTTATSPFSSMHLRESPQDYNAFSRSWTGDQQASIIGHEGSPGVVISRLDGQLCRSSSGQQTGEHQERPFPGKSSLGLNRPVRWKDQFIQRRSSLGHNWDGTLERISALSLVKFASLLIEVVSKLNFVVESVEQLGQQARFKEF